MGELIEFEGKGRRPELLVEREICDHLAIALTRVMEGLWGSATSRPEEFAEEREEAWDHAVEALERYRRLREDQLERLSGRGESPEGPESPDGGSDRS